MELIHKIDLLIEEQQSDWEQFRTALQHLENVQTRKLEWGDEIEVNVQFNPDRIVSASAVVDKAEIKSRPCFLCAANRPSVQKEIDFLDKYIILVNPFPILKNHLTIPLHSHVPQLIGKKIEDMLELAAMLPGYIVFYNGPKCGASAPDHFHLQAGLKSKVLTAGENELRTCLIIESESKEEVSERFDDVYFYLKSRQPDEEEPMMNLIAFTEDNKYILHIFPRKAHRPKQYFKTGSKQLLVSPGALDMAGLIITPRAEDFEKIQKEDIEDIYLQVSLPVI